MSSAERYSCRARGERAKREPTQDFPPLEVGGRPSLTWARCFKRIYEINPLECPRCKGTMRIIAFLTNEREIMQIADALEIPRAQAPPKIPRTPKHQFFDSFPPDDFT